MTHIHKTRSNDLPSIGKLVKSTILAVVLAGIILVTAVLPAEYGIDPTGVGELLGLKRMGDIKVSLAREAATQEVRGSIGNPPLVGEVPQKSQDAPGDTPVSTGTPVRTDEMTISLAPNEGKEIKLIMAKGRQVKYEWWTDRGKANFDSHADSKKLDIAYHSYGKGATERDKGTLEAAFDGNHGWFWRNRTNADMIVTLQIEGEYSDIVKPN